MIQPNQPQLLTLCKYCNYRLITQRSLVQIQPLQPEGLCNQHIPATSVHRPPSRFNLFAIGSGGHRRSIFDVKLLNAMYVGCGSRKCHILSKLSEREDLQWRHRRLATGVPDSENRRDGPCFCSQSERTNRPRLDNQGSQLVLSGIR
jgi:hypothetical protein